MEQVTKADERMAAALAKEFGGEIPSTEITETQTPVVETPVVVTPETLAQPVVETPAETPKVEVPKVEIPAEPVKSFEEILAEKFGGKFKSVEEIEQALAPKEVFANEKIKKFNELALKGVDVTSKEFLEIQSLDFDKMDKTDDILFEQMKRSEDGKGLSDKAIRFEINKKYNVDAWIEKDESELTDEDNYYREKMVRDADVAKGWLVNYKNERTLEKQIDPVQKEAMARQAQEAQQGWEQFVDSNLVNKVTKLSAQISYKDETGKLAEGNFDYAIEPQKLKEVGDMMKRLTVDSNVFFDKFRDKQGNINHEEFFKYVLKAESYDKALALAASDTAEKRALAIEKSMKNTNFKPAEVNVAPPEFVSDEESMKAAIRKQKII